METFEIAGISDRVTRRHPEMEKYVEIRPVIMEDSPDAHNVFLRVKSQSFRVTPYGCETKEEAEWIRDMLCIALASIVKDAPTTTANSPDRSI